MEPLTVIFGVTAAIFFAFGLGLHVGENRQKQKEHKKRENELDRKMEEFL